MSISVRFSKTLDEKISTLILPLTQGPNKGEYFNHIDQKLGKFLSHALKTNPQFKAKNGETLVLSAPKHEHIQHVILLGLGEEKELSALAAEKAGGLLWPVLKTLNLKAATLLIDSEYDKAQAQSQDIAASIANGIVLRAYDFSAYKSKSKKAENKTATFKKIVVIHDRTANAKAAYEARAHVTEGVFKARDLVNTPPNDLYPDAYAKMVKKELKPLGIEVDILDEKKMEKMGMGAIMAVGKGSARQPRMVIMRWNGLDSAKKKKSTKPIAFVGKGVTFDTGGISIKPSAGMDEMKMDMGGSACVVGLMKTLALRKARANVIGVIGLAENMPSSNAYRPGDILTSYSGKTIEVLNTDAEGRLVLADCLTYVQQEYDPSFIIDLATLTGAMMVALGNEYCGTFSNDDTLWKQLENASTRTGEKLWRMPLDKAWNKEVESAVADIQNLGKGRYGGACTAAAFLEYFIDDKRIWAHMDIAGTAWRKSDQPTVPKFGSGFGVRVLNDLVAQYYEG